MSKLKRMLREDAESFIPGGRSKAPKRSFRPVVWRRAVALTCAAVLFLSAGAAVWLGIGRLHAAPDFANCYVTVDINPAVEIVTGQDGRVLAVKPKNKYAVALLEGADFAGQSPEEALRGVLALAARAGYLDKTRQDNALLLGVLSETDESRVMGRLKEDATDFLRTNKIYGVVLTAVEESGAAAEAERLGVTPAKLSLIEEIVSLSPFYTKMQLAEKPVRELNELLVSLKAGTVVYDDDEFDELYDFWEEAVEEIEELAERLEEAEDNEDNEKDDEAGEDDDEAVQPSDAAALLARMNELLARIRTEFALSNADFADFAAGDAFEKRVKQLEKLVEVRLDERVEAYKQGVLNRQEELRRSYLVELGKVDWTTYDEQFAEDFEDWLEEQEERWEEDRDWEGRKQAWSAARGLD